MVADWQYRVDLVQDTRVYSDGLERQGIVWQMYRSCLRENGTEFKESIIVSPSVFRREEEAKQDALRTLTLLLNGVNEPLVSAIQWMLEDS